MTVYTGLLAEDVEPFDLFTPPYAREVRRG
jgi:hypothetical protein